MAEEPNPSAFPRLLAFALVAGSLQAALLAAEKPISRRVLKYSLLAFAIGGLLLLVNVANYQSRNAVFLMFHHQGAFIGMAQHLRAGLIPFYDVPLLYGLGPTLAVAGACELGGCWSGMQLLIAAANLTTGLLLLCMALTTRNPRGPRWTIAATFVLFTACFFWIGFPQLGSIPASTPSGGGLRFLPMVLVASLLFFGRPGIAALVLAPAVLWSPEVAAMSIAVFGVVETARVGFLRAAGRTIAITAAAFLGMVVVHRLIFGVWVQPDVFAEYMLHVPAPLPILLWSDFLLLVAGFALAAWNLSRPHTDTVDFRRDLVASLAVRTHQLLFRSQSSGRSLRADTVHRLDRIPDIRRCGSPRLLSVEPARCLGTLPRGGGGHTVTLGGHSIP